VSHKMESLTPLGHKEVRCTQWLLGGLIAEVMGQGIPN